MRTRAAFFGSLVAVLGAMAAPSAARADTAVVVLGLTSVDGDDELAGNLSGALRNAASRVDGWLVDGNEATLAQMLLAHGCADEPDTGCLQQIAATLGTQGLVYGTIRRAEHGVAVSLAFYEVSTGHIGRTASETVPSSRTDVDDLREVARTLIARLAGPLSGAVRVATSVPNATVSIDGETSGTTDAGGEYLASAVPVGEHQVSVQAAGYQPWTGTVTISDGQEITLDATLTPGGGGGGGGGIGVSTILGIGLLGVGALSFVGTIYSWARIAGIQSDPEYRAYRGEGNPWPDGMVPANVCTAAAAGTSHGPGASPARVAGMCNEASTLEVLQYVFLVVAAGGAATGAILIATDSSGQPATEAPVTLVPSFGPDRAYLGARIRF